MAHAVLRERYPPATTNKLLAVLREVWRQGQMSAEDYYHAADLPMVAGTTLPRGHTLPADSRDAALLAIMLDAGTDIATVQKLAGHGNGQTTAIDHRRGEAVKRRRVAPSAIYSMALARAKQSRGMAIRCRGSGSKARGVTPRRRRITVDAICSNTGTKI